jgi:hypothetical protein
VKSVVIAVLALVWIAALVGLSGWFWMRSRRATLDEKRALARKRAERDRRRPERDLERVVREATSVGAVVVVARRGHNPTRVTWSDGSVWLYYDDPDRYREALERGMAPVGTAHVGPPPAMGTPRPSGHPHTAG